MLFLKKQCTVDEYLFFKHIITKDNGNKYFNKRKLFKPTFVEDYLSNNNRALNNFMTRLFILAPNLLNKRQMNPRYLHLKNEWKYGFHYDNLFVPWNRRSWVWKEHRSNGLIVVYYRKLWNKFLKENIDDSTKKFNSPFKKGETYDFKLRKKNDTCIQLQQ